MLILLQLMDLKGFMKHILLFIVLIISSAVQAETISFNQLVGSYSVESKDPVTVLGDGVRISYDIILNANETIILTEKVVQTLDGKETILMQMKCNGSVVIDNSQNLISNVTCTNGEEFIQKVTLAGIENTGVSSFTAPVFSSLYGMTIEMIFTKFQAK